MEESVNHPIPSKALYKAASRNRHDRLRKEANIASSEVDEAVIEVLFPENQ